MPPCKTQACHRKTVCACVITSLALLVGLLISALIYHLTLRLQDVDGEHSNGMHGDSRSKAIVLTDEAVKERWDSIQNFSQAWNSAEQKAAEPAHMYLDRHQSTAMYMYTDVMLRPRKQDAQTARRTGKPKGTFEPRSLYRFLGEAIQILRHSQVTCHSTNFTTETLFNLNTSDTRLVRFSTFILASAALNFTANASCFQVRTCFGADITHYSAFKQQGQVLIPPYEVFTLTDVETDAPSCRVVYRLKSNMDYVYDRESNALQPISVLPMDGFWLGFTITCVLVLSLLLPFVIVKVMESQKKICIFSESSLHNSTYSPATVVHF